jgi:thioesterase domain-containing protein
MKKNTASRETSLDSNAGSGPLDELESSIRRSFREVFDLDEVGGNDDFFDLGGDSLDAEALSAAILSLTGHQFQIAWLLKCGTPRLIAQRLLESEPLSRSEERPPIFAVHGRKGFMLPRRHFLESLAEGQELRMFELPGIRGETKPLNRVEDIAAAYVAEINKSYPVGPILLAAFCMGSLIAVEIAAQLTEQGREVRQLVLIDPSIPDTTTDRLQLDRPTPSPEFRKYEGGSRRRWSSVQVMAKLISRISRGNNGVSNERMRTLWEMFFVLRLRRKGLKERFFGRRKSVKYELNLKAQAKLFAAFRSYQPRRFGGSAAILSSFDRNATTHRWETFLPNCTVYIVGQTHSDVIGGAGGATARKLQALCDQALASESPAQFKASTAR